MSNGQELLDIGFAHDRTTGKEEWLTPPGMIKALGGAESFDLDPCAPTDATRPWPTAARHYSLVDNGLLKPWAGRVWLNPPYGPETKRWVQRMTDHGDGIVLIFARTETGTFFPWVWEHATGILFLKGRIRFYTIGGHESGSAGAPSCLIAYGAACAEVLRDCALPGKFIQLKTETEI